MGKLDESDANQAHSHGRLPALHEIVQENLATNIYNDVTRKQDFLIYFSAINRNPNGDPADNGAPRVDQQTGHGLVTPGSVKYWIRDAMELLTQSLPPEQQARNRRLISRNAALNTKLEEAYDALGLPRGMNSRANIAAASKYILERYVDARCWGYASVGNPDCGNATGAIQLAYGRSIDPITVQELTAARGARPSTRYVVPYGLYRVGGHFSPYYAKLNGLTNDDFELFWKGLVTMLDRKRDSNGGGLVLEKVYIFTHAGYSSSVPSHKLFGRINVPSVPVPTSIDDYEFITDLAGLPQDVTLTTLVG
jgi:CRISPR-associated protein Csd2